MSLVALMLAAAAAATPVDLDKEKRELLRFTEEARIAHLTYDPDKLLARHSADFVSVNAGRVERPAPERSRARFQAYFASVRFKAWDDLAPPIITISDDGGLATILIQKRVRLVPKDKPDGPVTQTDFAWLETWRKEQGVWRMKMIVSTNAPAQTVSS